MTPRSLTKLGVCFALAFGFAASVTGCGNYRRPIPIPVRERARLTIPKAFRVGALDFGKGDRKTGITDAVASLLLSELKELGRFSVFEGGSLSSTDSKSEEILSEGNAKKYVDAYVNGTLTSLSKGEACFDVRLSNAFNHEVLFARPLCVPVATTDATMVVQKEPIKRLAEEMGRAIKRVGYMPVVSADGRIVHIAKGKVDGITPGMVAYVVATGDAVADPGIHGAVRAYSGAPSDGLTLSSPVIVGQLAVYSVEDKYSVCELYDGEYALPGDMVFFK